jgi:hypothetical protein
MAGIPSTARTTSTVSSIEIQQHASPIMGLYVSLPERMHADTTARTVTRTLTLRGPVARIATLANDVRLSDFHDRSLSSTGKSSPIINIARLLSSEPLVVGATKFTRLKEPTTSSHQRRLLRSLVSPIKIIGTQESLVMATKAGLRA